MADYKKLTSIILLVAIIGIPFIFREKKSSLMPISDAETIVILTPHNEAIRQEYALAFKKWYKKKTGKEVNVDWRYQGGGRDATRYLESMYNNNFKLYWERELGRPWTQEVASAFNSRSENFLSTDGTLSSDVSKVFFDSDVSCGMDILFGGGVYEAIRQADRGNLVTCDVLYEHPEMFDDDTIPHALSNNKLWDERGRWFGGSLSAFGIIYNVDSIKSDGIEIIPQTWMDIGRPEFYRKLAVVDPTKSSSTLAAFIMLIQQQMQICVDRIKAELGVEELPEYYQNLAISEGWTNSLKLIQKIVANGRYFAESSTRPVSDVSAGNCLAGIAVDFYGSSEAKHLEERSGSKRFRFVMPIGGGAPSPDPIAMFRGAPNPELAKSFIEFIVSLDGQKILYFNVGTDGGPQKSTMRHMPILKTIYDKKYDNLRCDASINPYKSSESFTSHDEWTDPVSNSIGVVIKLAFLDSSDELSDAMGAIINAKKDGRFDDAERAYQVLSEMDDINYDAIKNGLLTLKKGSELLPSLKRRNEISDKFRKRYIIAKTIANGNQ